MQASEGLAVPHPLGASYWTVVLPVGEYKGRRDGGATPMLHLPSSWLPICNLPPNPSLNFSIAQNAPLRFPIR